MTVTYTTPTIKLTYKNNYITLITAILLTARLQKITYSTVTVTLATKEETSRGVAMRVF